MALSSLSSLLFSLFSALFSRLRDHFDLIFEALGPLKRSKSMQRVIKFKVFGVLAVARALHPEKHPKSIPRVPQSTQNLTPKRPRSSQGRAWSTQGARQKRPDRTLTRPGSLWESFRAPQDLILELLKLTFPYFWDPPATQQRMPVLCSLLALLSPLLSPSWVLGPDARPANFDPGT